MADLPLQALLRADPELRGQPVAVTAAPLSRRGKALRGSTDGAAGAAAARNDATAQKAASAGARLLAVSHEAARLGVRPGQTVAQARATAPSLRVRCAHAGQVRAARDALFDIALGFAPRVEPSGDLVYLEVGDLGRLYPTEREVALALQARARAAGLDVGVGVAASKSVARLAARAAEVTVIRAGAESAFVGALSVSSLADGIAGGEAGGAARDKQLDEAVLTLGRWGVERAEELARLPVREVTLRLGAMGALLHQLASARCDEPLAARAPSDEFEEGMELDFAIEDLEALGFVLRGLIDRLLARLGARHLACASLGLRLRLESGGHDVREIPLAAPTRDASSLLSLVRLAVERRPPSAAVVGASLLAHSACAPLSQLDLFRPAGPSPERLATTLAKLQALVGEHAPTDSRRGESHAGVDGAFDAGGARGARDARAARDGEGPEGEALPAVGSPRPVDTHREEAMAVVPFAPSLLAVDQAAALVDKRAPEASALPGVLGFRRFRPERLVEVLLDGTATPRALLGEGISCHVVIAAGPFRVTGEWWSKEGWARDYWDVHATDGALYRLYRDRAGLWFVGGYYD